MLKKTNHKEIDKNKIPVIIFCGGKGTRLQEETQLIPKPLVKIGDKPILWHIMKIYSEYGFNNFILPVGYKGEKIKEYFYNYPFFQSDFTINLCNHQETKFYNPPKEKWQVTILDTGLETQTGARLRKIKDFIPGDLLMLTYGDGVGDVDIDELLKFHLAHGKIGTVTGVRPLPRFGQLTVKKNKVIKFGEKPHRAELFINGGFFILNKKIFQYIPTKDDCIFEREPLEKLARDGQLAVYKHTGFWQCIDTLRELEFLNRLWETGESPWKIWK